MSGQEPIFRISELSENNIAGSLEVMERSQVGSPAWFFIYLFGLLACFAWIRMNYGNILVDTVKSAVSFRIAARMFKDNSLYQRQIDNILYTFYFISTAFLLFLVELKLDLTPYGLNGGLLFLFNLLFLGGIFLFRIVILNLTGALFGRIGIFREYLYNIFIYNKLTGVSVLPFLLFMVYTTGIIREVFFFLTAGVIGIVVLMRFARGIVFYIKKDVLIFYMFLYLWALEIVPLAFLYRWLVRIL